MERLTDEVLHNAIKTYEITSEIDDPDYSAVLDKCILEFLHELKAYRDAEEQGLLVKLPCKCQEVVWTAEKGFKTHKAFYASPSAMLDDIEHGFGIGYTREEAEAALERMK